MKENTKNHAKQSIHAGHRERLRNKVDKDPDLEIFEDHEVLEFRLSLVIPQKDVNPLAHELIQKFGSLDGVLAASPKELFAIKEMTTSAAYMLATDLAFTRRVLRSSTIKRHVKLSTLSEVYSAIYPYFIGRKMECFCVALLDVNYKIIQSIYRIGISGKGLDLDPAEIVQHAIREGAVNVVIAHNHPSGNLTPSLKDIEFTDKLYNMLKAINVELCDHVIFSDSSILSFHNCGILVKIKSDFIKRTSTLPISSSSEVQLVYINDLNEHILDPKHLANNVLKAVPKNKFINDFSKHLSLTETLPTNEEFSDVNNKIVMNVYNLTFDEYNNQHNGEVATTITKEIQEENVENIENETNDLPEIVTSNKIIFDPNDDDFF